MDFDVLHDDFNQKTVMTLQRIYDWRRQWTLDPSWRPYNHAFRGRHHRIFTVAEEKHIANYVVVNYLLPDHLLTDATFRQIAIQAFLEKHKDDNEQPLFQCSPRFITGFKAQHKLSSRRAHLSKRPGVTDEDKQKFLNTLAQLLRDVSDHARIINVDESCWKVHHGALRTWAATASQNIALAVSENEKDSFTVVTVVTAARTKLPLFMIASEKTSCVEISHFGEVGYHQTAYSETGWQTAEIFAQWSRWLRSCYNDGAPIWLILDCYSVHRQETMRKCAQELGINLVFIPPGLTDELQPLDRFVFGVMKATCRRLYRLHCDGNPGAKMNWHTATAFLIRAWEAVSTKMLDDAWTFTESHEE
jgi:hypothetical protein